MPERNLPDQRPPNGLSTMSAGFTTSRFGSATAEECLFPRKTLAASSARSGPPSPTSRRAAACLARQIPPPKWPAPPSGRNAPILAVRPGNNQTICPTNANCFLMASTNRCECKSVFTPVPPDNPTDFACMGRCDNLCKNDGKCRRDKVNAPAAYSTLFGLILYLS